MQIFGRRGRARPAPGRASPATTPAWARAPPAAGSAERGRELRRARARAPPDLAGRGVGRGRRRRGGRAEEEGEGRRRGSAFAFDGWRRQVLVLSLLTVRDSITGMGLVFAFVLLEIV